MSGERIESQGSGLVERRTIEVVPRSERSGHPSNQFTLWFGSNMQITSVVDGAIAIAFALGGFGPVWAVLGLLVGNVLGGAVMALHSAQGPRLGLPQMISSRAQFGVMGAAIPLMLVVLMYLGFATTSTVLAGQATALTLGVSNVTGMVIFGVATAVIAILGYRIIHGLGRLATVTGLLGFTWLTYQAIAHYDIGRIFSDTTFHLPSFLMTIALAAGWQLTFGPYVADYSRYLPESTSQRATFGWTFAGSVIGAQWAMTLGVIIGAVMKAGFIKRQVGSLGDLAGPAWVAVCIYLVIIIGKLAINTLNAYGGFMTIVTTITAFTGKDRVPRWVRTVFVVLFILATILVGYLASANFLTNFKNFILTLLMVFIPWSSINLVDFYLVSKERVNLPALYDPKGPYGAFNWMALGVYLVGILVQIPFMATALYIGPLAERFGGADVSWIVGLVLTAILYYPLAKRFSYVPEQTIHPDSYYEDVPAR